jgi:hypothetical protein
MGSSPLTPSQPTPTAPNSLSGAAQQFVTATVGLVQAVEQVGTRVEGLEAGRLLTASDLTAIHDRVSKTEGRLDANDNKPPDKTKWMQTAISVMALMISIISVVYSVKFGGANMVSSSEANKRDAKIRAETVQSSILTLITQLDEVRELMISKQPLLAGSLTLKERYETLIAQIDNYRDSYGFSAIGERKFASLMRTIFIFGNKDDASQMWQSVGSVRSAEKPEARYDLALVHAEYAKLVQSRDEMDKAVGRINPALEDALTQIQRLGAHLAFAEMYSAFLPPDAMSIKHARRERDATSAILTTQRTAKPDFAKEADVSKDVKDVDSRLDAVAHLIKNFDDEQSALKQKAEQERKARNPPTGTTTTGRPTTEGLGGNRFTTENGATDAKSDDQKPTDPKDKKKTN